MLEEKDRQSFQPTFSVAWLSVPTLGTARAGSRRFLEVTHDVYNDYSPICRETRRILLGPLGCLAPGHHVEMWLADLHAVYMPHVMLEYE